LPIATLTSKGQVTIPKEVRDALRLRPGDRVDFRLEAGGGVRLLPARLSPADLVGSLRPRRRGLTLGEMERVIRGKGGRG
jgi:AbrB family looped-hinge helix DNA binding protein